MVNADNLVIGPGSQPSSIWREPDRMYRARVVAHMTQLLGLRVILVSCLEDGVD